MSYYETWLWLRRQLRQLLNLAVFPYHGVHRRTVTLTVLPATPETVTAHSCRCPACAEVINGPQGMISRFEPAPPQPYLPVVRILRHECIPAMSTAETDAYGAVILVSYSELEMTGLMCTGRVQALRPDGQ